MSVPHRNAQLTLQRQQYVPGGRHARVLLPLVFCRECGQEYLSVSRIDDGGVRYVPRRDNDAGGGNDNAGYLFISDDQPWPATPDGLLVMLIEPGSQDRCAISRLDIVTACSGTVPVAVEGFTVAVKVTSWPEVEGLRLEVSVIVEFVLEERLTVCVRIAEVLPLSLLSPA